MRVQSRRYQRYTWKEGVEGGMGTNKASWDRIGGAWQYILPLQEPQMGTREGKDFRETQFGIV